MKTSLKLIAIILAAGLPCVAFAESVGVHLPSAVNAVNAIGLFSIVVTALVLIGDYAPRTARVARASVAAPAANTLRECNCLAA